MSSNASHSLKLFNPFSLQLGSGYVQHLGIQNRIYYAESRFRQALLKINRDNGRRRAWMQKALKAELASTHYTDSFYYYINHILP